MTNPYITFDIPGDPVPFARAASNGKQRFTPAKQRAYMESVKYAAIRATAGAKHLQGALAMTIMASWKYPKSWPARDRVPQYRTGRPDIDNTAKIIADALNGIAYLDDAQIAVMHISKLWGAQSFARVRIERLDYEAETDRRTGNGAGVCKEGSGFVHAASLAFERGNA